MLNWRRINENDLCMCAHP